MKKLLLVLALLAVVALLYYSLSAGAPVAAGPAADPAYAQQVRLARQRKDLGFRAAVNSPIPAEARAAFNGLRYFAPAPDYRVVARLSRATALAPLPLALSGGPGADAYARWGTAEFELGGQPQKLVLLQKQGETSRLFVPFTDPTNGTQTYAGGRYLDLPVPAAEAPDITLDFNATYNPFCAYNHAFSCPKPPAENRLTVPMPAGEQAYQP